MMQSTTLDKVLCDVCLLIEVGLMMTRSSNGIRSVQEPSRNRSRPGQVIIDSISVPAMSEPARIGS